MRHPIQQLLGPIGLRRRAETRGTSLLRLVLVAESATAGFYLAITRGLAPIVMAAAGLSIREIMLITMLGYVAVLLTLRLVAEKGIRRLRISLLLVHGSERVVWSLLPLVSPLGAVLVIPIYSLALTLASLSGLMITTVIYSGFDDREARRIIASRSAVSAASNIVGQLVSVAVLAASKTYMKFLYLYILGSGVGLIATAVLAAAQHLLPSEARLQEKKRELAAEEAVSSTLFLFIVLYMAAGAVLATTWAPYLMKWLRAPDYVAASLGLVQMVTSIAASMYWARVPYAVYKSAVIILPLIPVFVAVAANPLLHIGIAILYAFAATGANLLVGFTYAQLAKSLGAFDSSLRAAEAGALAQVMGLGTALAIMGLGPWAAFIVAAAYAASAAVIALLALPEVALVSSEQALIHARRLYIVTSAAFGFVVVYSRKTVIATLRLLALLLALFILVFTYRVLYYLVILTH
ncbi:hypothetical protein PYJP_01580 [Pyrofollis japonicus]|uniref:hypothetical protein n=1 Tax=Pyrofollis japonicus TaxID=3060460 RepID=UPI00295A6D78|nr:hypothetical protein [Pyrofollis japonicus]BEP16806.1 hypothetical protein PYJP_01580 [Pyrofollis japonicus]